MRRKSDENKKGEKNILTFSKKKKKVKQKWLTNIQRIIKLKKNIEQTNTAEMLTQKKIREQKSYF